MDMRHMVVNQNDSRDIRILHTKNIFRKEVVLTIKNFNDLLADEVLDFIIIHHSLFKNRKIRRQNANIHQHT